MKKAPIILAVLLLLCLGGAYFFYSTPVEFFEGNNLSVISEIAGQYGGEVLWAPFVVLAIIFAVILIFYFKKQGAPKTEDPRKALQNERQKHVQALKEAEKQFMKHKIDKETFDRVSQEANESLIRIESELDAQKSEGATPEEAKKIKGVSFDKRKALGELLEQKKKKVHELKIAENSYYKRKIDDKAFQHISSQINAEIVSIEGQIKALQAAEEIEKLKEQLKEAAQEIIKQKKSSENRNNTQMEDDIFYQASKGK